MEFNNIQVLFIGLLVIAAVEILRSLCTTLIRLAIIVVLVQYAMRIMDTQSVPELYALLLREIEIAWEYRGGYTYEYGRRGIEHWDAVGRGR